MGDVDAGSLLTFKDSLGKVGLYCTYPLRYWARRIYLGTCFTFSAFLTGYRGLNSDLKVNFSDALIAAHLNLRCHIWVIVSVRDRS